MKMFKNLLFAVLGVLFLLPISVSANSATSVTLETYHFTNGDYLETILFKMLYQGQLHLPEVVRKLPITNLLPVLFYGP